MTTSPGPNQPLSMKLFASSPSGVRLAISSRSKLPVDKWISLYFSTSLSDCVPFPLPGGPNRIKLNISEYNQMCQMVILVNGTYVPLSAQAQTFIYEVSV